MSLRKLLMDMLGKGDIKESVIDCGNVHKINCIQQEFDPKETASLITKASLELGSYNDGNQFIEDDSWCDKYVNSWYKELFSKNQSLKKNNDIIIAMYADKKISAKHKITLPCGRVFKRGTKGHTLNIKSLEILQDNQKTTILGLIGDRILCHLDDMVCILEVDSFRYVKN